MSIDSPIHFHAWMSATTMMVQEVLPSHAVVTSVPVSVESTALSAPSGFRSAWKM